MGTTPTTTKKSTAKITGFTSESARTNAVASGRISASAAKNLPIETSSYSSNPVSSSTSVRSDIKATGADVSKLTKAYREEKALLQQQQAALAERRATEVAGIKSEFDIAKSAQELGQAGEYASRATQLVTSGGGFLGATQSQQGVLQNLSNTHEAEKTALLAKREAAINAANTAYEDKDFALAREMVKSAKDLQTEIYRREQDFADRMLKNTSYAKDKAESLATLSDEEFNKLTPETVSAIDQYYYPGYTKQIRQVNQAIAAGKNLKEDLALRNSIQSLINKTPQGQKIVLADGTTYVGLKKPSSASTSGLISSSLANQIGVPSLAGKDESDVILSLSFNNPPQWYKDYHKASGLNPVNVTTDWKIFQREPDIEAYKNSSVVSKRIEVSGSILNDLNIDAQDTAGLDE